MKTPDLIIFAKQPVAGQVKTRLHQAYTAEEAARIAEFSLRSTLELVTATWPGEVYLYAWPDSTHPLFKELAQAFHVHLANQVAGDLGTKMRTALEEGIARNGAAAVMGSDVPHCPESTLEQAFDWLAKGKNVIGPCRDGGYYLIGLQQAEPELFRDIPWGEAGVLDITRARATALGFEFEDLPTLRDLDRPEDVQVVAEAYIPLQRLLQSRRDEH